MKIYFELEENETWITPLKAAEALDKCRKKIEATSFQKSYCGV